MCGCDPGGRFRCILGEERCCGWQSAVESVSQHAFTWDDGGV